MITDKNIEEGVDCMYNLATVEPKKLDCMNSIRNIAKKVIKEKGLSERDIRKTLGSKRYEK